MFLLIRASVMSFFCLFQIQLALAQVDAAGTTEQQEESSPAAATTVRVVPDIYVEGTELNEYLLVTEDDSQKLKFEYCKPVVQETLSTSAVCTQLGLRTYKIEEIESQKFRLYGLALLGASYDYTAIFGVPFSLAGSGAIVGLALVKQFFVNTSTNKLRAILIGGSVGAAVGVTAEVGFTEHVFVNPIEPFEDARAVNTEQLREGTIQLPSCEMASFAAALDKLLILTDYY